MRHLVCGSCLGILLLACAPLCAQVSVFEATGGPAGAGGSVQSTVLFETFSPSQGWSFGLCHDDTALTLAGAVEGAATLTVNLGGPADFVAINPEPDPGPGVTMGVVVNFLGLDTLAPGADLEILIVDYDVLLTDSGSMTDVCFCDTLGTPPVQTTIVLEGGASEVPEQLCGTFFIPDTPFIDNFMCTGGVTDATMSWELPGGAFEDLLLYRDGSLLEILPGDTVTYTDPGLAPGTYSYALIGIAFIPGDDTPITDTVSCTVDIIPVTIDSVQPDSGYFLGGDLLTVTGTGFDAAPDTTVEVGGVTCTDIQVIDDTMLTCLTPPRDALDLVDVFVGNSLGSDTATDAFQYGFIRGEINSDDIVDIADSVFGLDYLFTNGPEPMCLDALDTNDSGQLDIADPVYLLTYLFALTPEPPPPFQQAGLDPTMDDIGCLD